MNTEGNTRIHMCFNSVNLNHDLVTLDDFTILHLGYKHNKFKMKISEASFIKSNRPNCNKQDTSVPLKLFNWDLNHFLSWLFFVFTFESTFPNPVILAVEIYSAVNTIEFGLEYFKYFTLIQSQILFAPSQYIFWLYGFKNVLFFFVFFVKKNNV